MHICVPNTLLCTLPDRIHLLFPTNVTIALSMILTLMHFFIFGLFLSQALKSFLKPSSGI